MMSMPMTNTISRLYAYLTRNWRAPFDPRQANFGYTTPDGTFYPGYMTRGGEMRYEKKGVHPGYDPAEYVKSVQGTQRMVATGLLVKGGYQAWDEHQTLHVYRSRNRGTGKHCYWHGSMSTCEDYLDAGAWVNHGRFVTAEHKNEA